MPLMWAHAEYIKLLRSTADGRVFDLIDEVVERYQRGKRGAPIEIWKLNRRVRFVAPGTRLRVQTTSAFTLHWTNDDWQTARDTAAASTPLGTGNFVLVSVAPFDPATHQGQKVEARGLIYQEPGDSLLTLTSLESVGACEG